MNQDPVIPETITTEQGNVLLLFYAICFLIVGYFVIRKMNNEANFTSSKQMIFSIRHGERFWKCEITKLSRNKFQSEVTEFTLTKKIVKTESLFLSVSLEEAMGKFKNYFAQKNIKIDKPSVDLYLKPKIKSINILERMSS